MKIARIALILLLSFLMLLSMTACRCEPSAEDWYFYSYKKDMVFINGVTLKLGFSDASVVYPFAEAESQHIGISFSKSGEVEFTDVTGKTHIGTYTYEHFKNRYTNFTITLENGDVIEGSSIKSGKNVKLSLIYNDIIYNFSNTNQRIGTTMDEVIAQIVAGELDTLNKASVVKTEKGLSVVFSEMISYPITEETAVYAVRISADGTYEVLDAVVEGEAFSTYNDDANYLIIYYIEK